MKTALIGIGSIGTIIAADLARQGFHLHLVGHSKETYQILKERGLKVTGVSGEYIVDKNFTPVESIDDLPQSIEYVFIVTKLPVIETVLKELDAHLATEYTIITLTNGIIEEQLMKKYGSERVMGCVISFGATKQGPAHSKKTSHGEIVLGSCTGREMNDKDKKLVSLLSKTEETSWTTDILGHKFSKLLINAAINTSGVVSGKKLGEILSRKFSRLVFLTLITEGVRVAQARDIQLKTLNGLSFYFLALEQKEFHGLRIKYFIKDLIVRFIGRKYKNLISSSLQSLRRGKKTEAEFLNGYIVEQGKETNIPTPLNAYIMEIVKKIEKKELSASFKTMKLIEDKAKKIWNI